MNGQSTTVPGGMMHRAVLEVVASVAAPQVADRLLADALAEAGYPWVPESPDAAAAFVRGPLRAAVAGTLGEDLADLVVDGLRPVVEVASGFHPVAGDEPPASSGVPASPGADRTTADPQESGEQLLGEELDLPGLDLLDEPDAEAAAAEAAFEAAPTRRMAAASAKTAAPPPPDALPVVLVATLDRTGVDVIARALSYNAEVRPVADMFEWLAGSETFAGRRQVLVLDCCVAAVDPVAAARTSHMLPPNADVVLWGASEDVIRAVAGIVGEHPRWHRLPSATTHYDLVEFIASTL